MTLLNAMPRRLIYLAALAGTFGACSGSGSTAPTPIAAPTATPEPTPTPIVASATAMYRVTFDSAWSASTHPDEFPPNPHFSGLIGGTHGDQVRFWEHGGQASAGIEAMAELGSKFPLDQEVEAAITAGTAEHALSGGGIGRSPGSVSLEFEIGRDAPRVTLVSMVAPSPDWFVGVSALSLLEAGDWVASRTVTLRAYDAGTDSGTTYTAGNADTQPREAIAEIEGAPLAVSGAVAPIGTFTFTRIDG